MLPLMVEHVNIHQGSKSSAKMSASFETMCLKHARMPVNLAIDISNKRAKKPHLGPLSIALIINVCIQLLT